MDDELTTRLWMGGVEVDLRIEGFRPAWAYLDDEDDPPGSEEP